MKKKYVNYYNSFILPKYGNKRSNDDNLIKNNSYPHEYSVIERVNLKEIQIISIDPDGCQDADDAFSIYYDNNKLFLAIHIADPTYYINIKSELWEDIINRTITHYPSNNNPIHMMPSEILDLSSLIENKKGVNKKAISIITEIDKSTFLPINTVEIKYTDIIVNKLNALSYNNALDCNYKDIIEIGLKVSKSLRNIRSKNTLGTKLGDINYSYPIYKKDIELYKDSKDEIFIKQMIAEFAIFANSFVGEYLKFHLGDMGIFRTCNTKEWLNNIDRNVSGQELLNSIIDNGISANYLANVLSHDLVGSEVYCHFTSPIRRVSDCVCHYLLKHIYLKNKCPFDKNTIYQIANLCHIATKTEKKIQHMDSKFRLFQVIDTMLNKKIEINIKFRITGYTGLFLNCNIININKHNVYISYCIRIKNINFFESNEIYCIKITKINMFNKFDQDTLPELDMFLINLFF